MFSAVVVAWVDQKLGTSPVPAGGSVTALKSPNWLCNVRTSKHFCKDPRDIHSLGSPHLLPAAMVWGTKLPVIPLSQKVTFGGISPALLSPVGFFKRNRADSMTQQRAHPPGEPLHAGQVTPGHRGMGQAPWWGQAASPCVSTAPGEPPKPAQDFCRRQHRMRLLCFLVKVRGVLMDRNFSSLPGPAPGCLHLPIIKWSKAINHHLRGKCPATTASQFHGTSHSEITACSHKGTFCSLSFCFPPLLMVPLFSSAHRWHLWGSY